MRIRVIVIGIIFSLCSCTGKIENNIFCNLTMKLNMADGKVPVTVTVDETITGIKLRNIETGRDFKFPIFKNGVGTVQILKGTYMISFDGDAVFEDGSIRRVRSLGHNVPAKAVYLIGDKEKVEINVFYLK